VNAPAIEWQQTPDRRTWRAASGVLVLTVTKLSDGMFEAMVEGPGVTERPLRPLRTRLSAQAWAESHAGGAR
jgi:hypothetical protein